MTVTVMYGTLMKTPPGATEVELIATMASAVGRGATLIFAGAVGPTGIAVGNTGIPVENMGVIGLLGDEAAADVSTTVGDVGTASTVGVGIGVSAAAGEVGI